MSFMIIGETGESKPITSIADFKSNYCKHLSSLELSPKDVFIISNKGQEFCSIDQITLTPDSIYFVYAKQYSGEIFKYFNQSISKLFASFSLNVSLNMNSIPDMSKFMPSLEANAKYLKGITPVEVKNICNGMIEFYDSFKLIFTKMNLNCKQSDKYKECYQNQCNGIEAIYKQQVALFDLFIIKRKEFEADYNKLKDKTEKTLRIYRDSIDKLKKIELHQAIQTANRKYLIDIYYEEDKMNEWRDKCIKRFKMCTEVILQKDQLFAQEKSKFRNEKNTTIAQLKNEWSGIVTEYDKLKREKSSKPLNIITELGNEFNKFKSSLSAIMEIFNSNMYSANPNYVTTVDEAVEYIKTLKTKYSNFTISSLQTYLEPFNELCSRMGKLMETSSCKVNSICNNLQKIKGTTAELTEKINTYIKNIEGIEKDFNFLEMPLFFINAYKESLSEIRRRLVFNSKIEKDIDRLNAYVLQEVIYRKQFIKDYESRVPKDYFQQFLFCDISLNIDFKNGNETQSLPNILTSDDKEKVDGFLNSEEENLPQSSSSKQQSNNCLMSQEKSDLELVKSFSSRIQELEAILKMKDSEIKKIQYKTDQSEKRAISLQSELNSIRANYENITENFSSQLAIKEQRIEKKKKENENLKKYINSSISNNKIDSCPMCKEAAINSSEYQYCSSIVKDYQEKLMAKIAKCSQLEKNYSDLINQTNLIKRTFFINMNETIEKKNNDLSSMKTSFENRLMYMEDLLSAEKKNNVNQLNSIKIADESKMKDFNKLFADYESENKKLKTEREIILKKMDEAKQKENAINKDLLILQSQYDNVVKELKNMESQVDSSRKKAKQSSNDINQYTKEIQKIKVDLEIKTKECDEYEKTLEQSKQNHIETLKEVHKKNQTNIDILNKKIEEVIAQYNQKMQSQKDSSQRFNQLEETFTATFDENSRLKQKILELTDKLSTLQSESLTIKEKLNEKEKKITQLEATITYKNTHITTDKDTTSDIMNTFNNSEFLLSTPGNDWISYKKIDKGTQCIFVPHSEGVYVCINLSQNINGFNEENGNKFFKCQYILNLESFDEEMKELILDNSLIIIGKASKFTQHTPSENDNPYNLPEETSYTLVTLDHPDYVLGFPGDEMVFRNYSSFN